MDKYDFFSKDNILILAADDKKKKGGGVNAILSLLIDLNNIKEKISACADAQDITENRSKIEALSSALDEHYGELLGMAKSGGAMPVPGVEKTEGLESSPISEAPSPAAPTLPSTPTPVR